MTQSNLTRDTRADEWRSCLTTAEVAARYPVSENYLKKLRTSGGGPRFTRWSPKKVTYDVTDIEAWLENRKHRSTSEYVTVAA
jgi:hypothetical protein